MKRFRNILFIADRQDGLGNALERAVALSQSNDARLTVMDVTPESGLAGILERTYAIDLNAQLREQRLRQLESLTQSYTGSGVPVYTTVVTGTAFIEIVRAVQRNAHDLVVKVAQQDTGSAPSLFGSSDMHLLRKCPCPVWIDRLDSHPSYHRVLAAVDPFDDDSGDLQHLILDLASSLAEREQARLDVIHAWHLPGESMLASGRGRISATELAMLLEQTEQRHREALGALVSPYGPGIDAGNVHMPKGRPARCIASCASELGADLIVMGTLGRVGVAGLLIGNTAEDVLRTTPAAVLAVKPGASYLPWNNARIACAPPPVACRGFGL